jgi:hypothetical protein
VIETLYGLVRVQTIPFQTDLQYVITYVESIDVIKRYGQVGMKGEQALIICIYPKTTVNRYSEYFIRV